MNDKLFIHKYQPLYFIDFGIETDIIQMLKACLLYTSPSPRDS